MSMSQPRSGPLVGQITRGKTAPNRLRGVDRFLAAYDPELLTRTTGVFADAPYVDLGYGAEPTTTLESAARLRRVNPELRVLGVEIDPERVARGLPHVDDLTDFRLGGFNLPLQGGPARLVRAFNVLRQYQEAEVAPAIDTIMAHVAQGGLLVERIRKQPYTVLLLDEIEKAHPDLFDILLQVMDHATLTDNQGREADFRHVTLIMTSNAGAREMAAQAIGFDAGRAGDVRREIERLFSPEFRNRLDEVVHFDPLAPDVMLRVVDKFVKEVEEQLMERRIRIRLSDAARAWLAEKGYDPNFGARSLGRVI